MENKKFKAAFLSLTPDADPETNKSTISSSMSELISVFVKDEDQAIDIAKKLVEENQINAVILCPGFTNKAVAMIIDAVGNTISVNVARGDPISNKIACKALSEAGFFGKG